MFAGAPINVAFPKIIIKNNKIKPFFYFVFSSFFGGLVFRIYIFPLIDWSVVLSGHVVAAAAGQKVKVGAEVGLVDAIDVQARIAAALVAWDLGRLPLGPAPGQLLVRHVHPQQPLLDIELDRVSILNQCKHAFQRKKMLS